MFGVAKALRLGLTWGIKMGGNARESPVSENSADESLGAAAARLERALARVDASVRSLNGRMRSIGRIEADVERLASDRARFAAELDRQSVRAKRLDDAAAQVSRRLVEVMDTVKSVLAE